MKEKKRSFNVPRLLLAALVGLALVGCPVDSPTAPQQTPVAVGGSSGAWSVTVVASPTSLLTDDELGSTVTISIRRADGSGPPPDGATALVSTNLGSFLSLGSGITALIVELFGGLTQVPFFADELAGVAVIRADIEESSGQTSITIALAPESPLPLEITGIDPISGPYFGGTSVTIYGNGFESPMLLELGGLQQEETVVSPTRITIRTESITTTGCSDQSDGTKITILETGDTATGPTFTYLVQEFAPVVDDVQCPGCTPDPTKIAQNGGDELEIRGENLRSPEVTVGGQSVNVESASHNKVTVLSPAFGDSFFDTEACTGGSMRVDTPVSVVVKNGETSCQATFAGSLLVVPDSSSNPCV